MNRTFPNSIGAKAAMYLYALPLLFLCIQLNAQQVEVKPYASAGLPEIAVLVYDKATGMIDLPGAVVELYTPSDTLRGVIPDFGGVTFPNRYKKDSVLLKVSHLGYKTVSYKTEIKFSRTLFNVYMEEDTTALNAIIIKDDAIAMVVHGDTTIFNAAAFNMRDEDSLRKLLERIPGINIGAEGITANGQKVSKILINGKSMFGKNVYAAMDMIYNKDIRKVRIYDEHDQDRLLEADTLGMKERVVDVVTNKSLDRISSIELNLSAGVFTENGNKDKPDWLAEGNASYGSFGTDISQITANAGVGKNIRNAAPMSSPEILANCGVAARTMQHRKFEMDQSLTVNYADKSSESVTSDLYSSSENYTNRSSNYTEHNSGKTVNAEYRSYWSHAIAEKNILSYSLDANYSGKWSDNTQQTESETDGNIARTDARTLSTQNSGSVSGFLKWKRLMPRQGRSLILSCNYSGQFGGGGGTRNTDSPDILLRQSLVDSSSIRNGRVSLKASYTEPFATNFYFNASYNIEGQYSFSRKIAWDEILNAQDLVNTHEYTHNEIRNAIDAKVIYDIPDKNFHLSLSLTYKNIYQLRKETLPAAGKSPDNYNYIGPSVSLTYRPGTYSIYFTYSEAATPPSIEQKRNTVNDSNPLFLIGGNPELKLPVIRKANFSTNIVSASISTTWYIDATYTECTDNIVNKVTFFPEATILKQYGGYKAGAGAQLSQPVNVNGNRSLNCRISAGILSKPLKSTFTPSVTYSFARNPFFQQEERFVNMNHDICFGLSYRSNFSKYFSMYITNNTVIGRSLRNGDRVYDRLSENVTANMEANFLKRMIAGADVIYDMFRTDSGFGDYEKVYLNAFVGVRLGKQNRSTIRLKGCDLLGMDNNRMVTISDMYVRSKYSTILGRSIFVSYQHRF